MQKMAESNLKEMMIDDINEEADEEIQSIENQPKLKWYLIDTERTFCKVWNFMITILTIYSLIVVPFILVFKDVYEYCPTGMTTTDFSPVKILARSTLQADSMHPRQCLFTAAS